MLNVSKMLNCCCFDLKRIGSSDCLVILTSMAPSLVCTLITQANA